MAVSLAEYTDAALWHAWFLKSFGEPKTLEDQLQHIALFGREESPDWATPWSAEIQRLLAISTPFSFQPWSGCDHTISAVTASQAAFYLMGLLHREVFADSALPDWNQAIAELTQQNRDYITANLPRLQERVSSLFNCLNASEWLRLAATVDVERIALAGEKLEAKQTPKGDKGKAAAKRRNKADEGEHETTAEGDKRTTLIHSATDEPPEKYRKDGQKDGHPIGPVTATKTAMGFALYQKQVGHSATQYRNNCDTKLESGTIWARESVASPGKIEFFFPSHTLKNNVEKWLREYKPRNSTQPNATRRK